METYAIYEILPNRLLTKVNIPEKVVEEAKPFVKGLRFEKCKDPEITQEVKDVDALVRLVRYL